MKKMFMQSTTEKNEFENLERKMDVINRIRVDYDVLREFRAKLMENRSNVEVYECEVDILFNAIDNFLSKLQHDMVLEAKWDVPIAR